MFQTNRSISQIEIFQHYDKIHKFIPKCQILVGVILAVVDVSFIKDDKNNPYVILHRKIRKKVHYYISLMG